MGIPPSMLTLLLISSPETWFLQGFLITVTLRLYKVFALLLCQTPPAAGDTANDSCQ